MSTKEIKNLIHLIESSLEDGFNMEDPFRKGFNPSNRGFSSVFMKPGTSVLLKRYNQNIEDAEECIIEDSDYTPDDFSYQPYKYTKQLDHEASFMEQGPVYKTKNVGPRLYGKEAWLKYSQDEDVNVIKLVSKESGEEYDIKTYSNDFEKKIITRNKQKYLIVYAEGAMARKPSESVMIILQIKPKTSNPAASAARKEKIKNNKLANISAEIRELEQRLAKLKAERDSI